MPPKRNIGKAAQTLQIGLGEGSPTHSEGENEPIIPPPLSPILGEHSFVNSTFNKDSESGDDRLGETYEAFLARFWKARLKCRVALPKQEFVKLAQNGLDIELRKKFEGMEFRDFFKLSYKVARYENLLQKDTQRKSASHGTYYGDANFDLDMAEVVADKPVVCLDLIKVQISGALPETTQPYTRCNLAADDLRWVIEEARARRNQNSPEKEEPPKSPTPPRVLAVKSNEETDLKAKIDMLAKEETSSDVIHFDPIEEEEVIEIPTKEDGDLDSTNKIIFEKPEERMARHIRPLYIHAHLDGMPISRVLVDNGAAVNVLPTCMLHKIGKSLGDLMEIEVTISDFTGGKLIFWNGGRIEVVTADDKPFVANTNAVEARYYGEDIGTIRFFGMDCYGRPSGITTCTRSTLDRLTVKEVMTEIWWSIDYPLEKTLNLFKQSPRRMSPKVTLKVKEEIEQLLKVSFIRISRYVEWLSNMVPMICWWMAQHVIEFCHLWMATVVMPFGLKNAGATYQRAMNAIFHDMIGRFMEIYIDDVIVKSNEVEEHLVHLKLAFERMMKHGLKMNPLKCAFGISIGNFLGYLAHERGLEVDQNKERQECDKVHVVSTTIERQNWKMGYGFVKIQPEVHASRQALADFLVDHPCLEVEVDEEKGIDLFSINLVPWKLIFDGSSTDSMSRAGIVIISPAGLKTQMSFQLDFNCTNNQAKYEALIIGLEVLVELKLLEEFDDVILRHVTRDLNTKANEMAQIASGLKIPKGVLSRIVVKRGHDELLLRCLGLDEYCQIMLDVNNGICGAHQVGIKMRCLICGHGFFWPSILKDCISYAKGCKACQIHGPLQKVPTSKLHPIIKPRPFRGWAINLIGKVYPPSSRQHSFIIVATDYFTKWVEAKPMKKVDQTDIIKFLKEDIIHKFGLPETVTSDQETVFVGAQVEVFAKEMGFRLLTSTLHYAQANGQAEASNRIVINLLEKMVDDNPRRWHELLSDTIWAYRTSQRSSTKVTPFSLTYGHDAVLPMELSIRSLHIVIQNGLTSGEYNEAMILELEDLEGMQLTALDKLQMQKLKMARAYNKRVKSRSLAEGDLVWKVILPPGKKDPKFGKWSPNWEKPFRVHKVLKGGVYWLESLNGELHLRKINGIYLKPYYPMIWEARSLDTMNST
ncbi:hypothetical protein SLEP1_g26217 [Rubroshorea leprosula]|uniref:Integrase catalytic domain-containing protein n=1 Tax=Rubroshorea leprosula TaxID=152421 RepID=A0AAV5JSM1_9ROSI|nr:hypothetical protein SLEP1_g26217 [Rubroshorea leprosula]